MPVEDRMQQRDKTVEGDLIVRMQDLKLILLAAMISLAVAVAWLEERSQALAQPDLLSAPHIFPSPSQIRDVERA